MSPAAIRALDAELRSLAHDERRGLVHFLRRLEVLDRERAYAALNCGSAFEYLTRELHMSEGTAWSRVNAMRLIRRFPGLEAAVEDGRLNPTQLLVLGPVLTDEKVDDLVRPCDPPLQGEDEGARRLNPAEGRSSRWTPQAAGARAAAGGSGRSGASLSGRPGRATSSHGAQDCPHPDHHAAHTPGRPEPGAHAPRPAAPSYRARRRRSLAVAHRARRSAEGNRCTFVADEGDRCTCTTRLEMDHLEPARETGSSGVDDLTTRCRTHNQWRALRRHGRRYIEIRIDERREAG